MTYLKNTIGNIFGFTDNLNYINDSRDFEISYCNTYAKKVLLRNKIPTN